jgi:flavin-dependent dehydrogenase
VEGTIMNTININNTKMVPLIREVDVLIVGGGLAGISAAKACAVAGLKVLILESGTFLGYEIGRWQRPWLRWNEENSELIKEWFPVEAVDKYNNGDIVPLHMDRYKRKLEDAVQEAGVEILYGCQVIALEFKDDIYNVNIANKSGRQTIYAKWIVDTTETGITKLVQVGRSNFGGNKEQGCALTVRRTIEFTGVEGKVESSYEVPVGLGIKNNRVDIYRGAYDESHFIIDIPISVKTKAAQSMDIDAEIEYTARKKSIELAAYLVKNIQAFSKAKLGFGSLKVMKKDCFDPVEELVKGMQVARDILKGSNSNERLVVLYSTSSESNSSIVSPVSEVSYTYKEETQFNKIYNFPLVDSCISKLPVLAEADVLVVGGGTSGAVSAMASAGEGVNTVLLEMNSALGGTGTVGGVNFYWYGYRNGFTGEIDKRVFNWMNKINFPETEYFWGKKDLWSLEIKELVLLEMCVEARVKIFYESIVAGTLTDGDKVCGVAAATPYGLCAVLGKVTVDATGDGDVAAFAGADFIYGNNRDRMAMWGSVAWYKSPGQYVGGNFATTADISNIFDYTRFLLVGRRRGAEDLYDHSTYLAPRESRHILGEYVMSLTDQLLLRKYPDTISLCFSNHDPKGRSVADIVNFGILPPNLEIEIPYRMMLPKKLEQLLVTGKAISCTHDALAAIRMMDDLQKQGGAVGLAAALCVKNGVSPRKLNVTELQHKLIDIGQVPRSLLHYKEPDQPDYNSIIESLKGEEPFEWLEMSLFEKAEEPSPIVLICAARSAIVVEPLLDAYHKSSGSRRLLLAKLLLWHENQCGLEEIINEIKRFFDEEYPLPKRKASIRWCQMYPDHGVMTEVTYLFNLLSRAKDKSVVKPFEELVERIWKADRDYKDMRLCMFNYVDSVAYAAERLAFTEFAPLLKSLLKLPELKDRVVEKGIEVDLTGERRAYLVLCLARALARCGDKHGLLKLAEFTKDNRSLLARSAHDELVSITGSNSQGIKQPWEVLLKSWPESFEPVPWTQRLD